MKKKSRNVGKYEVGRTIGEGTFAKVKFARNCETGESVAMKVLAKSTILKHRMVDQIKREISIMKIVRHPNIVRLQEVLAGRMKIFIILEFVTGGELYDKIVDQGKLPENESRKYFQQLIDAVAHCHSKGVYHRDLKPENLLLDAYGNLKVSDFGLSALPLQGDGLLHTTCGTPNYVAPEVLGDQGYDGSAADIWSCGVILFVLMAGYLPFDEANLSTLYRKINDAEFSCPFWFSPEANKLLHKILDPNPKTRQNRWAPVLPSFGGRLAPRVEIRELLELPYSSRLEEYYLQRQSCLCMFSRPLPERWLRMRGVISGRGDPRPWLEQLQPDIMYKYMMRTLGKISMSLNFQRKLSALCQKRDIATIKRWWQTTDGVVLPLLLTVDDPDTQYGDIDKLIKFSLENCANNYAQFISRLKTLRKLLRKDYASDTEEARSLSDIATYWKVFKKHFPADGETPHRKVQYILCWAQTRATGLADSVMIRRSLDKCERTLSTPRRIGKMSTPETREYTYREQPDGVPVLPKDPLYEISWRVADRLRGETAHISAGPNACLESTRQTGGQTGAIMRLARGDYLHEVYNFRTLERESIAPRPVRSQSDLLSWSIQETLHHPTYVRMVRLHSVAEPSKARTITVCSLPYLIIVGVIAKLLQPAIASDITRSGLRASRNLWKFLFEDLDPNLGVWGQLRDSEPKTEPIYGLSSDLEEATDYGDLAVARQILDKVLSSCSQVPGFPTALAQLAKTLFIGKRFCLRHENGKGYRFFVKRNGWLMGDRITKVILTLAHEIVVISSGLHVARICGDDVIAFSRDKVKLEKYLQEVRRLGFKVSSEDSYISSKLAFYCEEGCIPPQKFMELPAVATRRQSQSMYIDYPRIRLLIPTHVETRAYSYTDVGRFALLGKETRWVYQSRQTQTLALFNRASVLQHLAVPEPADVMCPYTPIEIGGDGGFPPSWQFLKDCVLWKSRNLHETLFRMKQLLTAKWGYRFVRSSNLNDTTHRYHMLVPKIEELRCLLPRESIVEGNALLLGSIKVDGLETPEKTFFRLCRAHYWDTIFRTGRPPPEINFEAERRYNTSDSDINLNDAEYRQFHQNWGDLGFTYKDTPDYLVDTRYIHVHDYMNMGWWFGRPPIRGPRTSLSDIGGRKLLNEENIENFINHIKNDEELDPKVKEHLHKYVEADSYILYEYSRKWKYSTPPRIVILVTGDKRLTCQLARVLVGHEVDSPLVPGIPRLVCMVEPMHYLYGMLEPYEKWAKCLSPEVDTIVDFGAVAYAAMTTSGVGMWYDDPVIYHESLYRDQGPETLFAVKLVMDESGARERVSLTTQPGSQIRPGAIEITRS